MGRRGTWEAGARANPGMAGGGLSLSFSLFFFYTHLFMCLAMLGLSCGTEDLHHCMRTLVAACRLSISAEYGLLVPQTRIKPASTFTARQVLNHWTTEEVTGGSLEGGQSPCWASLEGGASRRPARILDEPRGGPLTPALSRLTATVNDSRRPLAGCLF